MAYLLLCSETLGARVRNSGYEMPGAKRDTFENPQVFGLISKSCHEGAYPLLRSDSDLLVGRHSGYATWAGTSRRLRHATKHLPAIRP